MSRIYDTLSFENKWELEQLGNWTTQESHCEREVSIWSFQASDL